MKIKLEIIRKKRKIYFNNFKYINFNKQLLQIFLLTKIYRYILHIPCTWLPLVDCFQRDIWYSYVETRYFQQTNSFQVACFIYRALKKREDHTFSNEITSTRQKTREILYQEIVNIAKLVLNLFHLDYEPYFTCVQQRTEF